MELNPIYVNDLITRVSHVINGQEVHHCALALLTQAYACIMESGTTQKNARKTLHEMLDYAIKNSMDQEKLKKEMQKDVNNNGRLLKT